MFISPRLGLFLLVILLCTPQISARQNASQPQSGGHRIYLDVVVTTKSGTPASGLRQQDFTILDNNVPQAITSFEAVDGRQAPIEVVLLLDAVNMDVREVVIEREDIKRFLKADRGRLSHPTKVAILTDKGIQFQEDFSKDGNAISTALGHYAIPLRSIGRDADHGGAADRFQISFQGFAELVSQERVRPGRKIIVWASPGWPLLSGQEQHIFGNIIEISKQLREGQITMYSVDPSAIADIGPGLTDPPTIHLRPPERKVYVDGASTPSEAGWRDLALPVIAIQSGGVALYPGNDLVSALRRCLADTEAYYEISFDPAIADRPNEYHHLEIRVAEPGLAARARQGYYTQTRRARELTAGSEKVAGSTESAAPPNASNPYYTNAHPYFDLPLAQLVERITELKNVQPAPDQQELPAILQKMGRSVDGFVREIGDLIADEDVTQEKLDANGKIAARQRIQDDYLILHHGYKWGASAEYRMDKKGNRLGPIGLEKGYLVTSGFALSCISFSSVVQSQSNFRYLGDEKIGSRETYVLGFAQRPGEATFTTTMEGTGEAGVDVLTQGILWVDKNSFQIIRMRTDLLAPNTEIGLDQETTEVTFGEMQIVDVPNPLWLPSDVDVYMEIDKQKFRNVHHYTNYRRYRVSVKIGAPR
jgi:VWFA-related protein